MLITTDMKKNTQMLTKTVFSIIFPEKTFSNYKIGLSKGADKKKKRVCEVCEESNLN